MGDAPNGISTGSARPFNDGDPLVTALVWEVDRAVKQAAREGGKYDTTIRHILNEHLRAPAQISGVSSEEIARAIYDASRERAGFHPISNERWGEFYDSGLQEALAIRAQADAVAELYGTSAQGSDDCGEPVTGEQEPVGWQWHVEGNCWTPCEPPSDEELRNQPDKFRPVYLGRMISAPASHDFRNSGESDLSVTPDCAGAGAAQAAPVPSMRDFIRTGITGFKEHELREIVATFCKLPGIAPRPPDPAYPPSDAFLRGVREAVIEKCANIADDHTPAKHDGTLAAHVTGSTIARAIRALALTSTNSGDAA